MTQSRIRTAALVALACSALPAEAGADGLPVLNLDAGPTGVPRADGHNRYVTVPVGGNTLVQSVRQRGGQILRTRLVHGDFTIPAVALDRSASGLSADGRTLVLIAPRRTFPRDETTFKVFQAHRLELRQVVRLDGDFSFDALSPDGSAMYLVEYLDRRDPTRYALRLYDLRARRLTGAAIVDPREPTEPMRGFPVTRATSAEGRWEYTLYDGAGTHPFIHALDTVRRAAFCIDLDRLAGRKDIYRLRLALDDAKRRLSVVSAARRLAVVDRKSLRVLPAAGAPAAQAAGSGGDAVAVGAAAAAVLALATLVVLRRRRRSA